MRGAGGGAVIFLSDAVKQLADELAGPGDTRWLEARGNLLRCTTAAVVKPRNTSIAATVPIARVAPSRRLWIEIFTGNKPVD